MFIIKLGGSVITDKTKECTFKQKTMDNLSSQIKKAGKESIIVHGAGSFGHVLAKKYDLNKGYTRLEQIKGFSVTHEKVQTLNSFVLKSLQKHDIPAVSISPHSTIKLNNHKLEKMDYKIFEEYLKQKFTPVTFGDVVLDKTLGFSICSGDLLVQALAKYFKPEKVIFVIDEDGLYTSNPKIDKKAKLIEKITIQDLEKLTTNLDSHADVTGGMKGKIDNITKITKIGLDTILLNGNKADLLYHSLVGEQTKNTTVIGDKRK
jgi:isopentenyl phosphate kinase